MQHKSHADRREIPLSIQTCGSCWRNGWAVSGLFITVGQDHYFRTILRHRLDLTGVTPPDDQMYSRFKSVELRSCLYAVPSQILRNGAARFGQAKSRARQGLTRRPVYQKKRHRQSVWITSELFRFAGGPNGGHPIILGTAAKPMGIPFDFPNSIVVARQGGMCGFRLGTNCPSRKTKRSWRIAPPCRPRN
jgi:hypothetical protein